LLKPLYNKAVKSALFKNSIWGLTSNFLQVLFLSMFFIITARKYDTTQFAHFLIATTIYQLIVAFSSMGLGQWFIREFPNQADQKAFVSKFFKLQMWLGGMFYIVNIVAILLLYANTQIRWLSIILGTNIIFDNLIYAIKNLNVAEGRQRTTFSILVLDGFLKLLIGCFLFIQPISIIVLSLLTLVVRFSTLNIFLRVGSTNTLDFRALWHSRIEWTDIKHHILSNWKFVVIGSISIFYWRFANIIVSKFLTLHDVANYEISFRIFSICLLVPAVASATVFVRFNRLFKEGNFTALTGYYSQLLFAYNAFAFAGFAFIYPYANDILSIAFGEKFVDGTSCLRQMFLTFLIFPTVLLQATLIVAMKNEDIDMWLNVLGLVINIVLCCVGLYFIKSLSVVNYSIFISFLMFHILQNIFLIKKGIVKTLNCVAFYVFLTAFIVGYTMIANTFDHNWVFVLFCITFSIVILFRLTSKLKRVAI